jgi:hypothetical protein
MRKALRILMLANTMAVVAGCGSSYDDFCKALVACEGGNDDDKQACIDTWEANKKEANDYKCGSQWDTYSSCQTGNATCSSKVYATTNNCSSQTTSLQDCVKGASGIIH